MIFQLISGVLECKVARYMQDYVVLELKFAGKPTDYKTITKDSFDGVELWVDDNYDVINN